MRDKAAFKLRSAGTLYKFLLHQTISIICGRLIIDVTYIGNVYVAAVLLAPADSSVVLPS
jgi:hypothetical protein